MHFNGKNLKKEFIVKNFIYMQHKVYLDVEFEFDDDHLIENVLISKLLFLLQDVHGVI